MLDYDRAHDNLVRLIEASPRGDGTLNEATTRLRFIDALLFDCLGWERLDCVCEERLGKTYTDYTLSAPNRLLIVEAKREGVYFEAPVGGGTRRRISFFVKNFPEVASAIEQAIQYCQSRGTPFGAVSNGHQLIAFVASRTDGLPPMEGDALVFDSLEHLESEFLAAWECLSKSGIAARRLAIELQEALPPPVPDKPSSRIPNYPGYQRRNELQTNLQILTDLFLEDIATLDDAGDGAEALRESYCSSGALSQYSKVSRELLRTRYSALFEEQARAPTLSPVRDKKGLNPDFVAEALSHRPILLLGDRGVGKSTFIKYLYKVDASDVFADALVFYIDFGSKPAIVQDLEPFVGRELERQLIGLYGVDIREAAFVERVLRRELQRFESGIYSNLRDTNPALYAEHRTSFIQEHMGDRDEYMRLSLEYVSASRRKQIVVFLDNVDQRPDQFQEAAFLIGQAIASNWPVTAFISLRPETFYRSRLTGALSAYHARAFTISPPRVDEVLSKRLAYGIKLVNRGIEVAGGVVHSDNLHDYLTVLRRSFSTNHDLIEFLDNMCGGNIRLAIDFVKDFISSAHVDTQKILDIYRSSGSYTVPIHEFLRAVTFGEHSHYYPPDSEIINLFDISSADGKEHFLASIVLAYLDRVAQAGQQEGFASTGVMYGELQTVGFDPRQVDICLRRLLSKNLIESETKTRELDEATESAHYRITSVGAYYVKRLIEMFTYVDAMIEDTPILDSERRANIGEARTLLGRLSRAEEFVTYLDTQWTFLRGAHLAFDWSATVNALRSDINRVRYRVQDAVE